MADQRPLWSTPLGTTNISPEFKDDLSLAEVNRHSRSRTKKTS